ncbi:hypothetical protein [Streptomyces sp. DASNCL29]|nr:hypothetical protein [Streptomyces sp. DASNCL29]
MSMRVRVPGRQEEFPEERGAAPRRVPVWYAHSALAATRAAEEAGLDVIA